MALRALIFDVDGTLAETEEIHRAAFNRAFAEDALPWHWDVDHYRELLRVTGGKERLRHHAALIGLAPDALDEARIGRLHARKNAIYGELVRGGACELRPGVETLIRDATARGLRLAIATTTSRANVEALLAATFAGDGETLFETLVCGEDVAAKKPDPEAYVVALDRLGLAPADCLALEDSSNGLSAARGAGLRTIVTPGLYTAHERFEGAAEVRSDLTGFDLDAW